MEIMLPRLLILQLSSLESSPNPAITPLTTFLEPYASVDISDDETASLMVSLMNYHAIILVDTRITEDRFMPLWSDLRSYVDNGGIVIISGYLALGKPLFEANGVFEHVFHLDWYFAEPLPASSLVKLTARFERKRTNAALRQGGMEVLPLTEYEAKGMLLADVEDGLGVYTPKEGSSEDCLTCTKDFFSGGSISYIGDLETSDGGMNDGTRRVWAWLLGMT